MDAIRNALREHFGFDSFRGPQEAIIRRTLAGEDSLVIMATGDGKSLCYQLPALLMDGLTLVVSPLIALMEDQVQALTARGLPASCIHSMLNKDERLARLEAACKGELRLLYVTPERFRVPGFLERIRDVDVALLAIDEAHCVSHWGHDFRPDYRRLRSVRDALHRPPCLALTATATKDVQDDIRKALGIEGAQLFHTGIEREKLYLSVHECFDKEEKLDRILAILDEIGGPGIVYSAIIKDLHQLEEELQRRGYHPLLYHGKLSAHERKQQQERFQASEDDVILATNAFGMGVDKENIRFIIHHQIPRTLEAYYQEVGRAGRDGRGSYCELLYLEEDLTIQRNFTEWANPDQELLRSVADHLEGLGERILAADLDSLRDTFLVKQRHDGRIETCLRLLRAAGCISGEPGRDLSFHRRPTEEEVHEWLPANKREHDLRKLLAMLQYEKEEGCRKAHVHRYFGFEDSPENCKSCDACIERGAWLAQEIEDTARRKIPRAKGKDTQLPVERGMWIEVRRFGLCQVKRVHVQGTRIRVDVELARNLEQRSIDLWRHDWRPVDR